LTDDDPDAALLASVARGAPRAAAELVARKLPRLLSLGQRMLGNRAEAEEVAQEVFLRVWKQAAHWQPGLARFDTWLHRVALNLCHDRLRQRPAQERLEDAGDVVHIPDPGSMPDQALDAAQRSVHLRAALATLPQRQREALVLQYYQELSNSEAAGLMNVSVDALESLLARARRTLRARLGDERKETA